MSNIKDLWYDWLGLNTWLFKKINSLSGVPFYSDVMKFISGFGEEQTLPYIMAFIAFIAFMIFLIRVVIKKGGNKQYVFMWFNIFLVMSAGFGAAYSTTNYIKNNDYYPRPYINLRNEVQSKEIKVLVTQPAKEAYVSFPSRKMMIITILVIAIWPALTENFRWAGIWLAFTVGWSQMAVGVNYPSDLVGGFSIALVQMMIIRNIIYSITLRIFRIGDA